MQYTDHTVDVMFISHRNSFVGELYKLMNTNSVQIYHQ
jgi:hypothetical protein